MMRARLSTLLLCCAVSAVPATVPVDCLADNPKQVMNSGQRNDAIEMLHYVAEEIRQEYYDPAYHNSDFEGRVREAEKKLREAPTLSDAFGVIAWMVDGLSDSHTWFIPPPRPYRIEDGWEMSFVGDKCLIVAVKQGSDAESKGVKPGDEILSLEGFRPTRENWTKLEYAFHTLSPRSGMHLALQSPAGQQREVTVMSAVKSLPKNPNLFTSTDVWDTVRDYEVEQNRLKPRGVEIGDVMIWKLPRFYLREEDVDVALQRASKHKALIVDLRGNPGGAEVVLTRLVSDSFDHDVKIGDRVSRKTKKPLEAKTHGSHAFSGKLIVLVDSGSASAAELYARVVQLEKRGIVVGDQSAGAVMEARIFRRFLGVGTPTYFGVEMTVADLKMIDGASLEHHGVIPDEVVLPTPAELAVGADPQLSRALELAGVAISPSKAGQLLPVLWR